ncbi:unnamed protein product [Mesocestoides corti]|uniref:Uncharacterized protein n=2 Tax=Mesocestoides corti TaxID=53468 RepID=A0A0R3UNG7_MESCO|nr:unnamed protein product [Mesocestoides corti]
MLATMRHSDCCFEKNAIGSRANASTSQRQFINIFIRKSPNVPVRHTTFGETLALEYMNCKHVFVVFVVIALLPISIQCHGSTADSIVDSILDSFSVDLANFSIPDVPNLGKVEIIDVGSLIRACPTTINETAEDEILTLIVSACLNVSGTVINMPDKSVSASVGQAKFDVTLTISKAPEPTIEVTISIPVWKSVKVHGSFWFTLFVSPFLQSPTIVSFLLESVIESSLQKVKLEHLFI